MHSDFEGSSMTDEFDALYARGVPIARLGWMFNLCDCAVVWRAVGGQVPPSEAELADYRQKERLARTERIRANIAASPSRSMFYREDVAA
jgi:hypothetical protein